MENKDKGNRPGIIPGVNEINSPEDKSAKNKATPEMDPAKENAPSSAIVKNTGEDSQNKKGDADAASG